MSPDVQILLSGALTFGVPLVLAVRELVVLGRKDAGPRPPEGHPRHPDPSPAPEDDSSLPPLPASFAHLTRLDPVAAPAKRGHVLEDA